MSLENVSSISETISRVERRLGPIDVLINNAAIAQEKDFMTLSVEDWDRMLAINLRGPFLFSQQCVRGMIDRGWGRIINISSIGGQWGGINQVHYAASKAALINLTRSLARLYSSKGVLSNAVAVGLVQSDMSKRELESPEGIAKAKNIPCGRVGNGGDVAKVVAFLSGEASNYVTGQTINVNGGMLFS
jgi:acetoacetyl-CoA reductase/3-oxoacyl-[acyl-carrier protein] reductase